MLAGLEVGDHFTLNLYCKVIPYLNSKILFILQNLFFADIFSGYLHVFAQKRIFSFGLKGKKLHFLISKWVRSGSFQQLL